MLHQHHVVPWLLVTDQAHFLIIPFVTLRDLTFYRTK